MRVRRVGLAVAIATLLWVMPAGAQSTTGTISGHVSDSQGLALPGVTVEGRSNVLPQPRVTVTDGAGDYRLPALIPGDYTVTYSLAGMQTVNRKATVILSQANSASGGGRSSSDPIGTTLLGLSVGGIPVSDNPPAWQESHSPSRRRAHSSQASSIAIGRAARRA